MMNWKRIELRCAAALIGAMLAALASAGPASASFPGRDGAVVYSAYTHATQDFPPFASIDQWAIQAADFDGQHTRTLVGCTRTTRQQGLGECGLDFLDPAVAPSGQRLVFDAGTSFGLMSMRGAQLRLRFTHTADPDEPAFSPTGRQLVFSSLTSGVRPSRDPGLWVSSLAGTHSHRIVAEGSAPDWSTRNVIAFIRPDGVYRVRPDGHGARRLVARRGCMSVTWSPDGAALAFTCGGRLLVARADGTHIRRIRWTDSAPLDERVKDVAWSPSGARFAVSFACEACSVETLRTDGTDVHVVAAGATAGEVAAQSFSDPDWQALR